MKAWVLQGGGARIIQMLPLIKNLSKPDYIVGTSAGALLGTLYSRLGWEKARDEVLKIDKRRDLFHGYPFLGPGQLGFWSAGPMLRRLVNLPKSRVEVECCTYDICKMKTVYLSDEPNNVVASASIPVLIEPKGHYVDGGVCENTPLRRAIDRGASEIHVILASAPDEENELAMAHNRLEIGLRCLEAMRRELAVDDIKNVNLRNGLPGFKKVDVIFHQPKRNLLDVLDFDRMREAWEQLK